MNIQTDRSALADRIDSLLPQTQCTRCGYPDCAGYAEAVADGLASINQCPPGGQQGIELLSALTGQPSKALNPDNGIEGPRTIALINENWCIGCTLCIKACPTDAIIGSNKRMHTVIELYCTGCELCIPVCPVDCIELENVSGDQTGWQAWSKEQAVLARERYSWHKKRTQRAEAEHLAKQEQKAQHKLEHLTEHSKLTDPAALDKKRSVIEAALARARAARGV